MRKTLAIHKKYRLHPQCTHFHIPNVLCNSENPTIEAGTTKEHAVGGKKWVGHCTTKQHVPKTITRVHNIILVHWHSPTGNNLTSQGAAVGPQISFLWWQVALAFPLVYDVDPSLVYKNQVCWIDCCWVHEVESRHWVSTTTWCATVQD